MSSVNILSKYMKSDRVITEHNQTELSKLEARKVNSVYSLKRLVGLPE